MTEKYEYCSTVPRTFVLGPVAQSLVGANRWLRGIKMYRFPWYLTLVSTNHASSNPGQDCRSIGVVHEPGVHVLHTSTCPCAQFVKSQKVNSLENVELGKQNIQA